MGYLKADCETLEKILNEIHEHQNVPTQNLATQGLRVLSQLWVDIQVLEKAK